MKKILILATMILLITSCNVSAYEWASQEVIHRVNPLDFTPLINKFENTLYYEMGNELYSLKERSHIHYSQTTKQSQNFMFIVKTDNGYLRRNQYVDDHPDSYNVPKEPIIFLDDSFNKISEYTFPYDICAVGYFDGCYYAQPFYSDTLYKSSDKENWEEVQENVPIQTENVTFVDDKVSFDGHNMIDIVYEDGASNKEFWNRLGEYALETDDDRNFYLTNDNVYFAKISSDNIDLTNEPNLTDNQKNIHLYDLICIYPYNDNIVLDLCTRDILLRLQTPKAPILNDLEQQKLSPYVMYNNKILGFEVAPVIVNDRTLIPVRFLFEQMGANVEWNNDTQTATISTDDKEINITINSQTATVNGQTKTLDTPAQLINGKTMIPVRFISEELGYTVNWDGEYRIITIE